MALPATPIPLNAATLARPAAPAPGLSAAALRQIQNGGGASPTQHDRLTGEAQKWVAQTFFATLLKQMRDSPFKSELFSGGQGGETFGSLYDQQLAERMSRSAGSKLVGSIVRRIEANTAYAQGAATVGKSGPADNRKQRAADADPAASNQTKPTPGRNDQKEKAHVPPALRA